MQILIIEYEPRAANQLQNMLKSCHFDYQLLEVIDTVEESVRWFETNTPPDLVFMDIQLADGLSFEIFQNTKMETSIIFTTAFDQYAIQAFKVNSIDYLLKPIKKEELNRALEKFKKFNKSLVVQPLVLKELLASFQTAKTRSGILVKSGGSFMKIKVSDVLYFYSEDSVTFGVTAEKRYIIDETLDQILGTLSLDDFFRINRGQIISKNTIVKFEPYFNHRIKLSVQNSQGQEFIVSRPKTSEFKNWMNS